MSDFTSTRLSWLESLTREINDAPETMPGVILRLHSQAFNIPSETIGLEGGAMGYRALSLVLEEAEGPFLWNAVFAEGLMDALTEVSLDKHLFGFSQQELLNFRYDIEQRNLEIWDYFTSLWKLLCDCVRVLRVIPMDPINYAQVEKITQQLLPELWERMWAVRSPLLDARPRNCFVRMRPRDTFHACCALATAEEELYTMLRIPFPTVLQSRVAYVLQFGWSNMPKICCKDCVFGLRWSFDLIAGIRSREDPLDIYNEARASAFKRFYEDGAPMASRVAKAGIAVMTSRLVEYTDIVYGMELLLYARRFCVGPEMDSERDHDVLTAFFAGCRNTICRGCDQTTRDNALLLTIHEVNTYFLESWHGGPTSKVLINFHDTHNLLSFAGKCLLSLITKNQESLITRFRQVLLTCAKHAEQTDKLEHREDPMTRFIRRLTRQHWLPTIESLRESHFYTLYASWKLSIDAYIYLGEALWLGDQSLDAICTNAEKRMSWYGPRARLRLCHWEGCLCSEWRPGHRLRICQGCRKVYYCGSKCQAKDWTEGRHQQVCGMHPGPRHMILPGLGVYYKVSGFTDDDESE